MLKISTETESLACHVGYEEAIRIYAKAGFDYYDFSMFDMLDYDWPKQIATFGNSRLLKPGWTKYVKRLREVADECGIKCNQSHAPFPTDNPECLSLLKKAIRVTSMLGGKIIVIHPGNWLSAIENAKMLKPYVAYAKRHGVKIATENMWGWDAKHDVADFAACCTPDDFVKTIDLVNDSYFGACLDIGHAEMMGDLSNAVDIIKALGSRLIALHLHDNDKWHDLHQIPLSNKIDYGPICKALKDIGYQGEMTLECNMFMSEKKEGYLEAAKEMAIVAKRLAEMVRDA